VHALLYIVSRSLPQDPQGRRYIPGRVYALTVFSLCNSQALRVDYGVYTGARSGLISILGNAQRADYVLDRSVARL
jgi:hypothetical protein